MAALIDKVSKTEGGGPGLLFERPAGFSMPVAANIYGSMSRICLALGVKHLTSCRRNRRADHAADAARFHGRAEDDAARQPPDRSAAEDVKDAPCQEVVKTDGGLDELRC
jgi:UbiD family decarboxylase